MDISPILRMPCQFVPCSHSQGQDKATPHKKYDVLNHRQTMMIILKATHIALLDIRLAALPLHLFPSMCHENNQEWVNCCLLCEYVITTIAFPRSRKVT